MELKTCSLLMSEHIEDKIETRALSFGILPSTFLHKPLLQGSDAGAAPIIKLFRRHSQVQEKTAKDHTGGCMCLGDACHTASGKTHYTHSLC